MHSPEGRPVGAAGTPTTVAQPLPLEVTDITKVFRAKRRAPLARLLRHKTDKPNKRAALDSVTFKVPDGEILRHPGRQRFGEINANPHPVHAPFAGPWTGTGFRARRG